MQKMVIAKSRCPGSQFNDEICILGFKQLSEKEMMQKALMHSIQEISKSRRNKNNTDDEYDSPWNQLRYVANNFNAVNWSNSQI